MLATLTHPTLYIEHTRHGKPRHHIAPTGTLTRITHLGATLATATIAHHGAIYSAHLPTTRFLPA